VPTQASAPPPSSINSINFIRIVNLENIDLALFMYAPSVEAA